VAGVEDALEDGEGALPGSPPPADASVPEPAPDAQRVAPGGPLHRRVVAPGLHSEVAFVAVGDLPGPAEVDSAVVDAGRGHLQVPDEAAVGVGLGVELVAQVLDPPIPPDPSIRVGESSPAVIGMAYAPRLDEGGVEDGIYSLDPTPPEEYDHFLIYDAAESLGSDPLGEADEDGPGVASLAVSYERAS